MYHLAYEICANDLLACRTASDKTDIKHKTFHQAEICPESSAVPVRRSSMLGTRSNLNKEIIVRAVASLFPALQLYFDNLIDSKIIINDFYSKRKGLNELPYDSYFRPRQSYKKTISKRRKDSYRFYDASTENYHPPES
jgi:hypothetical protein